MLTTRQARCASNKVEIARMWVCPIRKLERKSQVNEVVGRRGKPGSWKAGRLSIGGDQPVRIGKGAHEQLLEYAHCQSAVWISVDRQRIACGAQELKSQKPN